MPTGLEKVTVEIPFNKGQAQKFAQQVTEMDAPYYLRNVHLRKGSAPEKRSGHRAMTDASDGTPSFSGSTPKRIVDLDGELVVLTENTGSIGSGGGAGSSGDTVFAFAEAAQKWKAFGKVQRPTMDVIYPIATHAVTLLKLDTAANGSYLVTAETYLGGPGIFVTITDLTSQTERLQQILPGSAGGHLIKCVATTTYLCVVWWSAITEVFSVTKYDLTTLADTTYSFGVGSAADFTNFNSDAAVNGDDVFLFYTEGTTNVRLVKVAMGTGTASTMVTVETFSSGTQKPVAINIGSGEICCAWKEPTTGDVRIRSTTDLTTHTFSGAAIDVATGTIAEAVRVLVVSSTVRLVFWMTNYDASTEDAYTGGDLDGSGTAASIYWARVEGTQTTLAVGWGGAARRSLNLAFWGQPFLLSGRVFLPVVALRHRTPGQGFDVTGLGYYSGAYIVEVEPTISSAQATMMPHAACCLDVVGNVLGRNTSVVSNKAYVAITRRRQDPGDPAAKRWYFEHHQAQVCVFNFADNYRWQPAIHDHMLVFSGAYPYVFDGKSTHECGFAWRPEIMGYVVDAGGELTAAESYSYRVTFEYRDAVGRRWHSQVSYATEAQEVTDPDSTNLTMQISVSLLSLNMMQDAGFYFPGPLYAVLWRATAANANAGVWIRDTEVKFYPYETSNITLTSELADADIDDSERLYIIGGELENYPAPPCRSICQHRDRLFAFNTEWRTLDYTKPLQQDRGIEWSLSQRIPCPEDIVALESLEHVLLAFSKSRIYALEGAGPSSTGIPPDSFARLVLVNADIGCSEINAAWRCPAGVIFRSAGGFWLIDRGMGVSYLGAPVEADFDELSLTNDMHTLCGVVDQKNNCMRIYVEGILDDLVFSDGFPGALARFNYWFDTGRWSIDVIQSGFPRWATYHLDRNYIIFGPNAGQSSIAYEDPTAWHDVGEFYPEVVQTGWIRFDGLQGHKRVWRLLMSLEKVGNSTSSLRVTVDQNFIPAPVNSSTFTDAELGAAGPKYLRIHLFRQKCRAVRVSLVESEGDEEDSRGFRFHGIGFELGMKRGAFKAATVSE